MSPQRPEKPQPSEFDYRLRLYQNADNKEVQALYFNAMVWQSHAPSVPLLKIVATTTVAKLLYLVSIIGAGIWVCHPVLGRAISLTAGGIALFPIGLAFQRMLSVVRQNVKEDLINLSEHYMLVPDVEAHEVLKTSGPRGFWVVEATHKVTGQKELVGCGGLDMRKRGEKIEAELRRVAVSSRHTRRGVAAMIINAVVAHAKAHNLPSIYLSTSSMQGPAVELYKKHGWVEEERREFTLNFGARLHGIFMRLRLED